MMALPLIAFAGCGDRQPAGHLTAAPSTAHGREARAQETRDEAGPVASNEPLGFLLGELIRLDHEAASSSESDGSPEQEGEEGEVQDESGPVASEEPLGFLHGELIRLDNEAASLSSENRFRVPEPERRDLEEELAEAKRQLSALEKENAELVSELGRVYSEADAVPSPRTEAGARVWQAAEKGAFLEAVLPGNEDVAPDQPQAAPRTELEAVLDDFSVQVARQWGRDPDTAAAMGPEVSSLCGMIGAVPPGLGDAALRDLGRRLRKALGKYENINVVLFDDAGAAEAFAERNADAPGRRVLQISKHSGSGEDAVFVLRGGRASKVEMGAGD